MLLRSKRRISNATYLLRLWWWLEVDLCVGKSKRNRSLPSFSNLLPSHQGYTNNAVCPFQRWLDQWRQIIGTDLHLTFLLWYRLVWLWQCPLYAAAIWWYPRISALRRPPRNIADSHVLASHIATFTFYLQALTISSTAIHILTAASLQQHASKFGVQTNCRKQCYILPPDLGLDTSHKGGNQGYLNAGDTTVWTWDDTIKKKCAQVQGHDGVQRNIAVRW